VPISGQLPTEQVEVGALWLQVVKEVYKDYTKHLTREEQRHLVQMSRRIGEERFERFLRDIIGNSWYFAMRAVSDAGGHSVPCEPSIGFLFEQLALAETRWRRHEDDLQSIAKQKSEKEESRRSREQEERIAWEKGEKKRKEQAEKDKPFQFTDEEFAEVMKQFET
jgi:hypothetical protein